MAKVAWAPSGSGGSVELAPTLVPDPDFSNCAKMRHLRRARLKDLAEIYYASMTTPEVDQAWPDFVYRMEGVDLAGTGMPPL